MTRPPTRSMAGCAVALGLAWCALPGRQLPLYDGLGFPDDPYRAAAGSPGSTRRTLPPEAISVVVPVTAGVSDAAFRQTAEQGPQVALFLGRGAVASAPGTTSVTVTVTPLAPDPATAGYGNVYRVDAGPGGLVAQPAGSSLRLRAPGPDGAVTLRLRVGVGWTSLPTRRVGNDVYAAALTRAGDYVLARSPQPAAAGAGRLVLLVGGGLLLVMGLVIAAVRRSPRSR